MADTQEQSLTTITALAAGDLIRLVDDPSGTPVSSNITIANFLKSVSTLTEDTTPDGSADFALTYDNSATAAKKVLLNTILGLVNGLTEDTSPDESADYVLTYDASAAAPKKVKPKNIVYDISCRLKKSGSQAVTTGGGYEAITFDQEDYDTDTMHNTGANTSRITFTTAGKYRVWASIMTDGNVLVDATILLNATTIIARVKLPNATTTGVPLATEYNFAASDYVEIMIEPSVNCNVTTETWAGASKFA